MDSVLNKVTELLVSRFGVPADEIGADVCFTDLDLDSLALVEFTLVVAQEFGIAISEDEVSPDDTVAAVVRLIDGKKALV
jgi:acyl carrier protein